MHPQFVFMACRAGAEAALKREVARREPAWRLSFSRPGFVTFKADDLNPNDDEQLAGRQWVFARAYGISIGRLRGTLLQSMARQVWEHGQVATLLADGAFQDVHVWQRDADQPEDAPLSPGVTPLAQEVEAAIRGAAPETCAGLRRPPTATRRPAPRRGRVLDVVIVEPNEWWIGYHRAVSRSQRWPGGAMPIRLPQHAVSRAYAKLEEALRWSGLPLAAGDECVEIGCAPGGASQALLDRGLYVTGIDPAEVDPAVATHPRFRHLRKRGKDVRRSEFVGVRWLVADVNLAPTYTLDTVEAIVNHPGVSIRGLVLTLKLPRWDLADRLPEFAAQVHGWGYRDVRMRQLVTGGQEVCLVALRRKELRRLNRKPRSQSIQSKSRIDPPQTTLAGPHF